MPGKLVNKTELAAILGRSTRAITLLQKQGMPFSQGGGQGVENEYDTADVIEWLIIREAKGGVDREQQQALLLKEQTEIAKRRNEVESGELIEVDKCMLVVQRIMFGIRQKIVTSPLPLETRQAILADLQSLKEADFEAATDGEEEVVAVPADEVTR